MASTSTTTPVLNLPVRLVTRSAQYAIPPDQYMIPSTWKRFQLSQLINKVLDTGVTPVPFDFVHDGQIVRGPLGDWVASRTGAGQEGVGETVLELEYIESILPPSHVASYEHDDWVSAVDVQKKGLFLTGSYDNKLRVFSSSQTLLHTINTGALSGGITSISWLPSSSTPSDDWLASGNMDGITRVFSLPTISSDTLPSTTPSSTSLLSLHHHNGPVSSIQASKNPSSSKSLLTAGWDGTIALFPLRERTKHDKSVPEPLQTSKLQTKRRKLDKGLMAEQEKEREEGLVETTGWRVGPEAVFRGHKGRVGRAIWDKTPGGEEQKIWSCGWDGSVRGWDVETQVNFLIKQAPSDKVCLDMDQMAGSSSMLVTSHADRTVCLWDARDESAIISLTLPSAHASHIPFVRAHPTSQHLIATAGHDGELKIWDVRSPKQALLGVKRDENREIKGEDKLLAGDWDGEILAVGGEGCILEVYRGKV
ncbi:WD40-repeat-containing domain protein [Mrakia frigida]|uniref:WD40 repeat domain-containing protein n=1 Tax=Mrakia frigida TaxID=29902 RepID=UPI003FCC255D